MNSLVYTVCIVIINRRVNVDTRSNKRFQSSHTYLRVT